MRKSFSILTAALCLTLLAGCTNGLENVYEASSASETSVNDVSVTEGSESEVTEEVSENSESTEEIVTEEFSEESDVPVTEGDMGGVVVVPQETVPENGKVYDFDSDNPPDAPEFSMSLEGLREYEAETICRVRTELRAMLECSKTGEIPYLNSNGYEYALRSLENIKAESWSVVDEKYEDHRYEVTVTLDISESSVDEISVGMADYVFIYQPGEDRCYLPLRRVGELDESRLLPYYGERGGHLNFCNDFTAYFSDLFPGSEVTDFSSPDFSSRNNDPTSAIFDALVTSRQYYHIEDFDFSYEVFDTALKELYGFSADLLGTKETGYYNAETDTVSIPGRGTYWFCGYLADESYDEEAKTRTVTIDYYADDFHLVKSQTYRYTVRENENGSYTMLKMERLFSSDKHILSGCV